MFLYIYVNCICGAVKYVHVRIFLNFNMFICIYSTSYNILRLSTYIYVCSYVLTAYTFGERFNCSRRSIMSRLFLQVQ